MTPPVRTRAGPDEQVAETATRPVVARAVAPPGNAAVQLLARGPSPAGIGPLAAAGSGALARWHARGAPQAKWSVSRPSDPLEREADAVAARVTSGPPAAAAAAAPPGTLARQAAGPDDGGAGADGVPPAVAAVLRDPGPGAPMPDDVRERVEAHLHADLGGVQVHSDPAAQQAAALLGARAFTAGAHVFLGAGESAGDLALMAHEATHVVQQRAVEVYRQTVQRSATDLVPDFILDAVRSYAHDVPGYTMLTVAVGHDPISGHDVPRTPENLVRGAFGLVPFGDAIATRLIELHVVQDAYRLVDSGLTAHNLTLARLEHEVEQAWDEVSITNAPSTNLEIIERHIAAVYHDALDFVRSLVDAVLQMIRTAAADLAETYLADTPVWHLATKVLHHDPLRGTPVEASTVEILTDFLKLIGQEQRLAQMQERGTLQKTADWLDTQVPRFLSLAGELGALFTAAWDAIQPANLANLVANLQNLAHQAIGLVQRVGAFAADVLATVLRLVKDALLGWLSEHAHRTRGFRLLTVILGQDPFTNQPVARTPEALIGGFVALLPGGEATYAQLAESGVIAQAGAEVESAMGRLGISLDMIVNTFKGVWDSLTLDDLLAPIAAFERILARFGEPLARIVEFVGEVLKVVVGLILRLMNFPSDLLSSILSNAMAAIEDIKRDPVGFLVNMLAAVKEGLSAFFSKILTYLLQGLGEWLFHGLGALGIQRPADLSLKSILGLVLQVLGVTVETLWQKLGQHIGQEAVARIRGAIDQLSGAWAFIKDVEEQGIGAVWRFVADKLGNLWDTLLGMAENWIVTEIVEKAVAKLLSMLDPTGIMAVVNSFVAFFNAVQSAIEYLRDILQIVNRYVSTLANIAKGNIASGAQMLEQGLASAVPVAIGFLANQAGLGNVPEKVVELIGQLRQLIDEALDWLFEQAMNLGRAALGALGIGGEQPAEPAADPAAADVTVHETFETHGEGHELDTRPGSLELVMSSDDPFLLSAHPDAEVRRLYAEYLTAVRGATSASARKEAANEHLRPLLARVKAVGGRNDPGASAPGLGTVAPHSAQQSRLQRGGIRVWWLESEHVIPRGIVDATFRAHGERAVPAGEQEYNSMHTILIYERAADMKTGGANGDASNIAAFSAAVEEMVEAVRESSRPGAHLAFMANVIRNLLNEYAADAEARTVDAIAAENHENGARRGPEGSPEPPSPSPADVGRAADRQIADIVRLLQARYASARV